MRDKELGVIIKTYDLVKWSCQHTSRFPRDLAGYSTVKAWRGCGATEGGCGEVVITKSEREKLE